MKKLIYLLLYVSLLVFALVSCQSNTVDTNKLQIAVSIPPEETFVTKVAGDLVDVVTMIPPGASPSNYQPTPKEMSQFSESSAYFSIGVPTEDANIMPNIASLNKDIIIIELDEIVEDVYPSRYFDDDHSDEAHDDDDHDDEDHDTDDHDDDDHDDEDHDADDHDDVDHNDEDHDTDDHDDGDHDDEDHNTDDHDDDDHDDHDHSGKDPHIWLSPKRVIVMIETIRDELIMLDPDNATTYTENAYAYIAELKTLDENIANTMKDLQNKSFIIMHPSMGYFADDYGLEMIALEQDGKESTAQHLESVIDFAIENDIKVVFYQAEFDSQQAETLASEISGETLEIAPLSSDYIDNLYQINEAFKNVLQ